MLVLTRKKGQSIIIGGVIKIVHLGHDRYGAVKIGIEAPKNINIVRSELIDEK
ncbi:carbon storage regulator [Fangia hongkongensis]|uniref:carbon storage regulator n=1 Tax=Fangia hongkongensis TaxID=270495 RepID=UPI00036F8E2E|nr:carbon storage regulator [Fangia hongkongensis]